jgi:hypothetical protein
MGSPLKRCLQLLTAPAALVQIVLAALAFGGMTYLYDQSAWTAITYGLGCFILLQVGYFAGILYLVWAEHKDRSP